jgi:hypothetical protein
MRDRIAAAITAQDLIAGLPEKIPINEVPIVPKMPKVSAMAAMGAQK